MLDALMDVLALQPTTHNRRATIFQRGGCEATAVAEVAVVCLTIFVHHMSTYGLRRELGAEPFIRTDAQTCAPCTASWLCT